jgi:AraC-like DNA-binding protein
MVENVVARVAERSRPHCGFTDDPRPFLEAVLAATLAAGGAAAGALEVELAPTDSRRGPPGRWRVERPRGGGHGPLAGGGGLRPLRRGRGDLVVVPLGQPGGVLGAFHLALPSPPEPRLEAALAEVARYLARQLGRYQTWRRLTRLPEAAALTPGVRLVGTSAALTVVDGLIERAANLDLPVSIVGEEGTEKDFVAFALHAGGHRPKGPFETVRCGELTGPGPRRVAELLAAARGGTLYLRDVEDLAPPYQAALVGILAGQRSSGRLSAAPDGAVRLVSSSATGLQGLASQERLDGRLMEILHCVVVQVPPLRDRPEDAEPLLGYLASRHCAGRPWRIGPHLLRALRRYRWPGNFTEMSRVVACLAGQPASRWGIEHLRRCAPRILDEGARRHPLGGELRAAGDFAGVRELAILLMGGDLSPLAGVHPGVARAVRHLSVHFVEPVGLGEMASLACLTPAHFSTQFHRGLGVTFRDLRTVLRVERARQLLAGEEPRTVSEVCFEVGFGSLSAFERCFRRLHGCSPRAYRKGGGAGAG